MRAIPIAPPTAPAPTTTYLMPTILQRGLSGGLHTWGEPLPRRHGVRLRPASAQPDAVRPKGHAHNSPLARNALTLDRPGGKPADEVPLGEQEQEQHRDDRNERERHDRVPLRR